MKAEANDQTTKNWIYCDGRFIDPKAELQKKKEAFEKNLAERLAHDPWVRERAQLSLKNRGIKITFQDFEDEVNQIATKDKNEMMDHETWLNKVKNYVYWIPVIGPGELIVEGLQERKWWKVLLGGLHFSIDGWLCGTGIASLASQEMKEVGEEVLAQEGLTASRLSARERMAAASVRIPLEKLGLSLADVPKEAPINLNRNPFITMPKVVVDSPSEVPVVETPSQLVYLSDEKRLAAVESEGKFYHEIDSQTGEVDYRKPPIFKSSDEPAKFTATRLRSPERYSLIEPLSEAELKQRYTVMETLEFFKDADDFSIHSNFLEDFDKYFKLDESSESIGVDLPHFYHTQYQKSPTLRRMFNKFFAEAAKTPEENVWRIVATSQRRSCADFTVKTVYLNPRIEESGVRYLGDDHLGNPSYEGQPFQRFRNLIHEIAHPLMGKDDLASVHIQNELAPLVRRNSALDSAHRGGVVWSTDRVMYESMDSPVAQRMSYRFYEPDRDISIETLRSRMVEENSYLDKKLDAAIPIEEFKYVGGEELAKRYTVWIVQDFFDRLPTPPIPERSFLTRFLSIFKSEDVELLEELKDFFFVLYNESPTFKNLFDIQYPTTIVDETERFEFISLKLGETVVSEKNKAIYLIEDGASYLSDKGIIPVEKKRRFLMKMLSLLTNKKLGEMPLELQFSNRGFISQLTDQVFQEAGMSQYSRQLVEAFIFPGDMEGKKQLLSSWATSSRTATFEDRLLAETAYAEILEKGCFALSCFKRDRRSIEEVSKAMFFQKIKERNKPIMESLFMEGQRPLRRALGR
ncbi:hypothetical protein L1M70_00890 [Coxiella burnetii]|nr:hypothetical protein [Coxiella burnetii]MCF2101036.1 hypothetical protein [Coxiella burnetii]MCF2103007.1 hypothetical protein [Coxiella burnetii]MCF2105104.1 hypothetical protein [Coxiella burnetii]MCF2109154.1 hypothetical protein [Coxiella burnetii]MCF2118178.1 hypothetical protein [Coxiella burnetii]